MQSLELKIPPPIVALISTLVMWALARLGPALPLPEGLRIHGTQLFLITGLLIAVAAVLAFRQARTTVNPMQPDAATALVTHGILRFSRNPMYLGLALFLSAWAIYLAALSPFIMLAVFVLYITRFQIQPEERVLTEKFGSAYTRYQEQVRRWL